jgi:hypothetical protein
MNGDNERQRVELIKFRVAAIGTNFAGITSGMYIQTVGPIVVP